MADEASAGRAGDEVISVGFGVSLDLFFADLGNNNTLNTEGLSRSYAPFLMRMQLANLPAFR